MHVNSRLQKRHGTQKLMVSQPYFERVWGWDSHSRNGDLGVLWVSRNFKIRLQGSKHLALGHFLYHWKAIKVYMSKMNSHEPFRHFQHKLWQNERPKVKLAIWLPTTKSQESTRPWCVQVECDTLLENSQQELQLFFRPCPNQRSERKIIVMQSCESPNRGSFGIPPWESRDKKPFECGCHGEA